MTRERQMRWITVQIAKVKKTLASVSKSNDNGFDVTYSNSGSFMEERKTKERTALRRSRGVFVLDAWVVPYAMAKKGWVTFIDANGTKVKKKVGLSSESSFIRPAP